MRPCPAAGAAGNPAICPNAVRQAGSGAIRAGAARGTPAPVKAAATTAAACPTAAISHRARGTPREERTYSRIVNHRGQENPS